MGLGQDQKNDIPVIKSEGFPDVSPAKFRPANSIRSGEDITVIGFPLGALLGSTVKSTSGTVSSLAGLNNDTTMLQIDAPIQPGNSGGPVLDEHGLVAGMATAKLDELVAAQITGTFPQNVNFALKNASIFTFLSVQKIPFEQKSKSVALSRPNIVQQAETYTVLIDCE